MSSPLTAPLYGTVRRGRVDDAALAILERLSNRHPLAAELFRTLAPVLEPLVRTQLGGVEIPGVTPEPDATKRVRVQRGRKPRVKRTARRTR